MPVTVSKEAQKWKFAQDSVNGDMNFTLMLFTCDWVKFFKLSAKTSLSF